jgi:DNA-binding NtrC family response regulator
VKPAVIVVADDETRQRETLARVLEAAGHRVTAVADGRAAIAEVERGPVDIVITDLRMPDLGGEDVLRAVKQVQPETAVVILTAFGTVAGAVRAMRAGASDYLTKPVDLEELDLVVARALERRDLLRENRVLRRRVEAASAEAQLLGRSTALQEVLGRAARAAETDATVLVTGESGTGKELLARSIHAQSRRAEGTFVAVNCAALPEALLENELFGHERGAFTGAQARYHGRVERAAGGTLFLDEIGDVPASVQVKLLRFLQSHEFSRLGSEELLRSDVRVIAATHRDLEARIASGLFREDLYYRLNVVSLRLPPLRERMEDVPGLAEHFLSLFAKRYDRPVRGLAPEAMQALLLYAYPGNVRELENVIEQATVLASGPEIVRADLPPAVVRAAADPRQLPAAEAVGGDLPSLLERIERRVVLETLARRGGNQSSAARELGLTESGLRYKLKKWEGTD